MIDQKGLKMEENEFLSAKEIMVKFGIGRATIDRWEKLGNFPARIKIGPNKVRWKSIDINEWIKSKMNSI